MIGSTATAVSTAGVSLAVKRLVSTVPACVTIPVTIVPRSVITYLRLRPLLLIPIIFDRALTAKPTRAKPIANIIGANPAISAHVPVIIESTVPIAVITLDITHSFLSLSTDSLDFI